MNIYRQLAILHRSAIVTVSKMCCVLLTDLKSRNNLKKKKKKEISTNEYQSREMNESKQLSIVKRNRGKMIINDLTRIVDTVIIAETLLNNSSEEEEEAIRSRRSNFSTTIVERSLGNEIKTTGSVYANYHHFLPVKRVFVALSPRQPQRKLLALVHRRLTLPGIFHSAEKSAFSFNCLRLSYQRPLIVTLPAN